MKHSLLSILMAAMVLPLAADEPAPANPPAKAADDKTEAEPEEDHKAGSGKLATRQDELSADVQQLALEQTVQKVIDLLKECEDIMGEATERLMDQDTGGKTIAAQTEVIEKILEAAKARQQQQQGDGQQSQSQAGGAMMDMLERMAGKEQAGDQQGPPKEGQQGGDTGGGGVHGLSDTTNTAGNGIAGDGKEEQRRVPKAAGTAGKALPEEFRGALDAYNRGADKLVK
ncbi:hypothetical protein KBB96_11950 [Luteolibacter ambystomatis]|uniref:Secreted protein n=1 Tax=Luteolibacter ambystomatis TaxID=2824561 RepID=A0A975G6C7_9BACT|nr:hypothetical protein [Luteolibacter ambystomatis]QUE49586.1 hypothetical protein KBB96_11950 [Luteolibacter ambystomatis]